jgi:hypothetical protein
MSLQVREDAERHSRAVLALQRQSQPRTPEGWAPALGERVLLPGAGGAAGQVEAISGGTATVKVLCT